MTTLIELESFMTPAKLEYNNECEKLRNLEILYSIAIEKEKKLIENLKYSYLIHDIDDVSINSNKYTGNILYASYINDCDFTILYESIKKQEQYLYEETQNKIKLHTDLKKQQGIVVQAIEILHKACYLKESLLCKNINEIIQKIENIYP